MVWGGGSTSSWQWRWEGPGSGILYLKFWLNSEFRFQVVSIHESGQGSWVPASRESGSKPSFSSLLPSSKGSPSKTLCPPHPAPSHVQLLACARAHTHTIPTPPNTKINNKFWVIPKLMTRTLGLKLHMRHSQRNLPELLAYVPTESLPNWTTLYPLPNLSPLQVRYRGPEEYMHSPGWAIGDLVIEHFQRAQSCPWHRMDTARPVSNAWDSGRCL